MKDLRGIDREDALGLCFTFERALAVALRREGHQRPLLCGPRRAASPERFVIRLTVTTRRRRQVCERGVHLAKDTSKQYNHLFLPEDG